MILGGAALCFYWPVLLIWYVLSKFPLSFGQLTVFPAPLYFALEIFYY